MRTLTSSLLAGATMAAAFLPLVFPSVACADGYDKGRAVNYARTFAKSRNYPWYPSFSQDCANYVSQCLAAGGWTARYHSDPARQWWYGGRHDAWWSYSSSWVNAHLLFNFTRNTNRGVVIGQGVNSNRGRYNDLQPGDLVFCDWFINGDPNRPGEDGWIDHVYIVTGRSWNGILLSAHTTDRLDLPFVDIFNTSIGGNLGQRGRFYYMQMRTLY